MGKNGSYFQRCTIFGNGCDFAVMGLHDGLCHGQAEAIAALALASGGICTIAPVKELLNVVFIDWFLCGVVNG